MNGKWKIAKLIGLIIFIVSLPVLFFAFIGQNPMKQTNKATNHIAVVNEDMGAKYDQKTYFFGKEIVPALADRSSYHWSVVNRSQAENGLKNNEYDAVVYLPSDFSRNILSFNDKQPLKATVQYKIQPNLDAKHRERVQRELEASKNMINQKMSTLYWSYVAQEIAAIRKKFNDILEKEIAFQKAMYAFYTPSSAKLAEEIKRQKDMLQELLEASNNAKDSSAGTLQGIEEAEAEITAFVDSLSQYREYQQRQNELLQEGIHEYKKRFNERMDLMLGKPWEVKPDVRHQEQNLLESITTLRNTVAESHTSLMTFNEQLKQSTVQEQFEQLLTWKKEFVRQYQIEVNNQTLDRLQQSLIEFRQKLQSPSPGQTDEEQPAPIEAPPQPADENLLDALQQQLANLKAQWQAFKPQSPQESWEHIEGSISQLETEMEKTKQAWQQQLALQQQWQQKYAQLVEQLNKQLTEGKADSIDDIVQQIKEKEQAVLASPALPESRKQVLSSHFEAVIQNRNTADLLDYFAWLSIFDEAVQQTTRFDEELVDQLLMNWNQRDAIFQMLSDVRGYFEELEQHSASSLKEVEAAEESTESFIETTLGYIQEYDENVQKMQETITGQLQELSDAVSEVTMQLQEAVNEGQQTEEIWRGNDGEFVITIQQNTMQDVQQISDLIASIAEDQDHIVDYTNELHEKIDSVQTKADELNDKWAANVNTTKQIRNDVYRLLNNTMIDQQANGYVYDYLTNPVQVRGDLPEEQTTYTPPVVVLIIVLLCGMLIGFFLHYYSNSPFMLQLALLLLMNVVVGLIINIYSLKIYPMQDVRAIKWSVLTIVLLFFCSSMVRLAFLIGPFTGWILGVGLVLFFITPLLDLVLPNFHFEHPIAETYISIQYGDQQIFYSTVVMIGVLSLLMAAVPFLKHRLADQQEEGEMYEG
ncbi:type VII secretion protein EsaA [Geobacillus thermodenitrificans]|uniref:type VII secretion protein EsaA n=1 Tax=Geobacillus thermodenitrificans TaxID=33940 RepID=UPI000C29460F|nr:type VII secretion protein EsaA [Geobacillus thermodenitrificans]PJW19202.1 type VII secretion protein EsaA [Geobacillus thermodenitrificans]